MTPGQWQALSLLYDHPWFERMWILQEVVLPQKGIIVLGQYQWDADEFFAIAAYIRDNQLDTYLKDNQGGFLQCLKAAAARKDFHELQTKPPLLDLLREARERDASDPRDKVFAVLGLCQQEEICHIHPDYKDPAEAVYSNVARYILGNYERPLSLLSAVTSDRRLNIPSWVPDWSQRVATSTTIRDFEKSPRWSAGGSELPFIQIVQSSNPERLVLRGKIASSLKLCLDRYSSERMRETWLLVFQDGLLLWIFRGWVQHGPPRVYVGPILPSTLWKSHPRIKEPVHRLVRKIGNFGERKRPTRGPLADLDTRNLERPDNTIQRRHAPLHRARPWTWWNEVQSAFLYEWARYRKFAMTTDGSIGWVPLQARDGDNVCVFQGSDLPYIVRHVPDGEALTVIGNCYVHGLMHGELAANHRRPWWEIAL